MVDTEADRALRGTETQLDPAGALVDGSLQLWADRVARLSGRAIDRPCHPRKSVTVG